MRDDHLTPVLLAASEAELALLIEFLGRPPSGLLWVDRRVRGADATHEERAAAVLAEILRCSDHFGMTVTQATDRRSARGIEIALAGVVDDVGAIATDRHAHGRFRHAMKDV